MIKRVLVSIALLIVMVVLCIHDYPIFLSVAAKDEKLFTQKDIEIEFPFKGLYVSDDYGATWKFDRPEADPPYNRFSGHREVRFTQKPLDAGSGICKQTCEYNVLTSWLPLNGLSQFVFFPTTPIGFSADAFGDAQLIVLTPKGIIFGENKYRVPWQNYGLDYYQNWFFRPFAGNRSQPTPSFSQLTFLMLLIGMWLPPIPFIQMLLLHVVYRYIDEHRSRKAAVIFSLPPVIFCIVRFVTLPASSPFILLDLAKECALCAMLSSIAGVFWLRRRSPSKIEVSNLMLAAGLVAIPVPLIAVWSLWWGVLLLWIATLAYVVLRRGWVRYYQRYGLFLNRQSLDFALISATVLSAIEGFISVIVAYYATPHSVYEAPNYRMIYAPPLTAIVFGLAVTVLLMFIAGSLARPADPRKKNDQKAFSHILCSATEFCLAAPECRNDVSFDFPVELAGNEW